MSKKFLLFCVIISVFSIFLNVMLLSVTSILLMRDYFSNRMKAMEISNREYQYLQIDTQRNSSSVGFVSTILQLEDGEYFREVDSTGKYLLISNFGEEEYVCIGSCVCEDDRAIRRNARVIGTSLLSLVAAVSSLIAYEKAKGDFEKECVDEYRDECSVSSIKSTVEECTLTGSAKSKTEEESVKRDIRKFECKGNCVEKNFKLETPREMALEFGCRDLKLTRDDIVLDCTDLHRTDFNAHAKGMFEKEHLTPFCKENSRSRYNYQYTNGRVRWVNVNLCVGKPQAGHTPNTSVHCRQIFPKYLNQKGGNNIRHW